MAQEAAEMFREPDASLPRPSELASSLRLLRRGASHALIVQVGGAGIGLIVHVVLARLIGKAQYGVYTYVLTWVSVLSVLALLGQSSSVIRFVSTYINRNQWAELRGLRRGASAVVLAASCATMLVGALIVYAMRARLGTPLEWTLFAGFALLPILTQLQLNGAFYRGFKYAASSSAYNSLLRPTILIALVLVFGVLFRFRLDAPAVMLASVVGTAATLVFSEWGLTRVWPAAAKHPRPAYEIRPWLRLGSHLFFLAIIGIVLNQVDVLVLGGMAGAEVVGPYYAAVQLAGLAAYGLNAVNTILAPMLAEAYAAGDIAGLAPLVRHAAKLIFVVTSGVAFGIAAAGWWILELFGRGFAPVAYLPLLIILAGQCINAAVGPVGYVMTMTRFEREAPLFMGAGAVLNVLLSVALIPLFGLIGAAVASAASTVVWNVAALVFVRRKLGINPTIFPMPSP